MFDATYPGGPKDSFGVSVWIGWSGLTQTLKMKDILSSKIKDKSFIFNRLPKKKSSFELFGLKDAMMAGK